MLQAVWQGILTGLILSTFIGPIFFMLIELGLKGRVKAAWYLALGTFVSDILTVTIIISIAHSLIQNSAILNTMYYVGGLVLIIIGLQSIFKKKVDGTHEQPDNKLMKKVFIKGFIINSTNPNVFFFWFGAIVLAMKSYSENTTLVSIHFSAALLVVLTTDFLKGWAASLLKPYVTEKILSILSKISGLIIIYFGLKLMINH
jgi:threonine/homoserine/homoserine lactone efflux protein